MILPIIAISVIGILLMRNRSFLIRAISLVLIICVCCFLTYIDMVSNEIREHRKHNAWLTMYLGEPYEILFKYLSNLSEENPEELKNVVHLILQDKNQVLFRNTWLYYHDTSYSVFVNDIIARQSKTNQTQYDEGD